MTIKKLRPQNVKVQSEVMRPSKSGRNFYDESLGDYAPSEYIETESIEIITSPVLMSRNRKAIGYFYIERLGQEYRQAGQVNPCIYFENLVKSEKCLIGRLIENEGFIDISYRPDITLQLALECNKWLKRPNSQPVAYYFPNGNSSIVYDSPIYHSLLSIQGFAYDSLSRHYDEGIDTYGILGYTLSVVKHWDRIGLYIPNTTFPSYVDSFLQWGIADSMRKRPRDKTALELTKANDRKSDRLRRDKKFRKGKGKVTRKK